MSQPPEFKSSIPDHLLHSLDAKEKFIIESLSIMGQKSDWLIGETVAQSRKLETLDTGVKELDIKLKFTNGKIANSLLQIKALEDKNTADISLMTEITKIVNLKKIIGDLLTSKWFWIGLGIFVIGTIKIFTTPELLELAKKLVGLG